MTPEQRARQAIDRLLEAAGWQVVDRDAYNPFAGPGVAIREAALRTGYADYLLVVDGKALGVVEAKAAGATLSGVSHQSARYAVGLPAHIQGWRPDQPLPFRYESTGVETFFTNALDPEPRSRGVFAFHQPATLKAWAQESETLRARLQQIPPLDPEGLWPPQVQAITNLAASLAQGKPRALIQMATGAGKTFTAVNAVYRLIKYGGARRVLFLVDRNNLGRQALNEFQTFTTPDDGRKFTELYNVQRLQSNHVDDVSKVVITTIQRLYSIISGEEQYDADDEEGSLYETYEAGAPPPPKTVQYTPATPIEFFDFIVVDECHRSIYSVWGQVLAYFDAFLIGLTATPSKMTIGFFRQNLVMEYGHLDAVADGINVPGEVYHIRTRITADGSVILREEAGYYLKKMDRQTREQRFEAMDADFSYTGAQLDREVQTPAQIRTVVREFHDRLFTDLFPGRAEVPKTLVFARDDAHAEAIVRIIREEFGKGNDFCQKITYRVSGSKPEDLIVAFRTAYYPRIAVTVDMIATGTDVKAIEILLFMRLVKSPNYLVQMKGRGTRVIRPDELRLVSGDARFKDRFLIVDAVGVTEWEPVETPPTLNRKRTAPLKQLLEQLVHSAFGPFEPDVIATLADRLARLNRKLDAADRAAVEQTSGGQTLADLTHELIDALDIDKQIAYAQSHTTPYTIGTDDVGAGDVGAGDVGAGLKPAPTDTEIDAAAQALMANAARPLQANPALRKLLLTLHERTEIILDEISQDRVTRSAWDSDPDAAARQMVTSFAAYIAEHKDELTALEIIFNQPYDQRRLTFAMVKELAAAIEQPPHNWTTERLWRAFQQLEQDRVRGARSERVLADIVALVRHALRPEDSPLEPYPDLVQQRYENWLAEQAAAGRTFTDAQRWWLDRIAAHIGVNLAIQPEHLDIGEFFNKGGRGAAQRDLGDDWRNLIEELNRVLVVL